MPRKNPPTFIGPLCAPCPKCTHPSRSVAPKDQRTRPVAGPYVCDFSGAQLLVCDLCGHVFSAGAPTIY